MDVGATVGHQATESVYLCHQETRECVYLQCHSCSAAPEQVAEGPAGGLTRLPTFLNFSHVFSACRCSSGLRLFLHPRRLSQRRLRAHRSVPSSGTAVPAKPALGSPLLCLLLENLISETIRHCASCEQLKKPSKWTWPCVTGPQQPLSCMTLSKCEELSHCVQ